MSRFLAASGVPNDRGRVRWPLGLRILAGRETDPLREQLDLMLQAAAEQAANGPASPNLLQQTSEAVDRFRRLLLRDKQDRFKMPLAVYEESEQFLDQLAKAVKVLEVGLGTPGGETRLRTISQGPAYAPPQAPASSYAAPSSSTQRPQEGIAEVGLYDNYFQPDTVIIAVGTTVQWTNYGQHRHTVTSDAGLWSSRELGPLAIYGRTFAQPGIYSYHCTLHPHEMRGVIIVR
ncbi:MAG: cupredoxin domain-containing protein [Gemmataceae bacterium]|nr:cupredoxin domain-containing protein [Gemmataceae bacterium]